MISGREAERAGLGSDVSSCGPGGLTSTWAGLESNWV